MQAPDEKIGDIRIGERLHLAEAALAERSPTTIAAREICNEVRDRYGVPLSPSTYSLLRSDRRAPTVQQLVALARVFDVTPEFLLGELGLQGSGGVRWARRTPALSPARTRFVTALETLLGGHPLTEAACKEAGVDAADLNDPEERARVEWDLGCLAQSAVFLGVAEIMVGDEAVDEPLSEQVREMLRNDPKLPEAMRSRLQVTVLRNPVDRSFVSGGHMGPLIVGKYGLDVIGRFLKRHNHASQLGLAGGFHVASLVRQVGSGDLNWPERIYRLYPLGIEPFNKQMSLADVLVGGLTYRLGALLGAERIQGYTLRAFGYLTDDGDVTLRQRSITTVLDQLTEIDIAVLGVGDAATPEGPLQRVLATQGYKLANPENAVADVCLNPINEDGDLLPLQQNRVEQLVGVDTEQLRRMSQIDKNKLVLLLASGPNKATSTRAIVRGGFVNHVLCDDVLARALLEC
ncbi:MAG: transcriptional regulator with XRE-family HTH domain [Myxococcota bacterium]|jgi:transcriptional regulator with XRE-family HTH domain